MSGENSYFSRFFVKFVEVSAAGLASAICAYLLAHFGGLLPAPAPATLQTGYLFSALAGERQEFNDAAVRTANLPSGENDRGELLVIKHTVASNFVRRQRHAFGR